MKVRVGVEGLDEARASLRRMPDRVKGRLSPVLEKLGLKLREVVVGEKLAGDMLQRRTGALAAAQDVRVENGDDGAAVSVGFDPDVIPYGRFQEFGVDHSWLVEAKNGAALRFELGGAAVFATRVVHPPLPERSFLRSALAEFGGEVVSGLRASIVPLVD